MKKLTLYTFLVLMFSLFTSHSFAEKYSITNPEKFQDEKQKGFGEATKNSVFFREGKSMQWKNILDAKQIKKIEKEFSSIMKKLDYL